MILYISNHSIRYRNPQRKPQVLRTFKMYSIYIHDYYTLFLIRSGDRHDSHERFVAVDSGSVPCGVFTITNNVRVKSNNWKNQFLVFIHDELSYVRRYDIIWCRIPTISQIFRAFYENLQLELTNVCNRICLTQILVLKFWRYLHHYVLLEQS